MIRRSRRGMLAALGSLASGSTAGCLDNPLQDPPEVPQIVGIVVGNWHPDPQTLNVRIESDDETLFDRRVPLPGGDPSEYRRPAETLSGYPSDVPPSATLFTWVDDSSKDDASTFDFVDQRTDCVGVDVGICSACDEQKGQNEITAPDTPDTLIKTTSDCTYPD